MLYLDSEDNSKQISVHQQPRGSLPAGFACSTIAIERVRRSRRSHAHHPLQAVAHPPRARCMPAAPAAHARPSLSPIACSHASSQSSRCSTINWPGGVQGRSCSWAGRREAARPSALAHDDPLPAMGGIRGQPRHQDHGRADPLDQGAYRVLREPAGQPREGEADIDRDNFLSAHAGLWSIDRVIQYKPNSKPLGAKPAWTIDPAPARDQSGPGFARPSWQCLASGCRTDLAQLTAVGAQFDLSSPEPPRHKHGTLCRYTPRPGSLNYCIGRGRLALAARSRDRASPPGHAAVRLTQGNTLNPRAPERKVVFGYDLRT